MPKRTSHGTNLTDPQIREIFSEIKPVYQVNEEWLQEQRVRLKGALAVTAEAGPLSRLVQQLQLWWEELPYLWAPVRPVLAWSAALVIGILVGRFLLTAPGAPVSAPIAEGVSTLTQS